MADFGSFKIETPQEVLAKLAAQRAPALASNNVRQRQGAVYDAFLKQVFGTPELDQAKTDTAAATRAFADLEKNSGEDDLSFRQRQTQEFFDAVKGTNPALAAQAAEKLTDIQNERMERDRLLAQERRSQSNEDRLATQEARNADKFGKESLFNNTGYAVNRTDGSIQAFDIGSAIGQARFAQTSKDPNQQILTREEMVKIDADKLKGAEVKLWNNSTFAKKVDTYAAKNEVLQREDRLLQIINADWNSRTGVASAMGAVNEAMVEWGALSDKAEDLSLGRNKEWSEMIREGVSPEARSRGVTDAMVLDLAYTVAKAKDPGGRLSDKDVEAAIKMMGGQRSDPRIMARTFLELAEQDVIAQSELFESMTEAAGFEGSSQGKILSAEQARLVRKRDALRETARAFLPKAEYDNIVHGVPLPEAGMVPVGSTSSPENAVAPIRITIQGLD